MTCKPPDGTKDGTLHFLRSGGIRNMFLWKDERWYTPFTDGWISPRVAGEVIGYSYSHPAHS